VFLLVFPSLRVLVSEDEMDLDNVSTKSHTSLFLTEAYLVGSATLVWTEHDNVGGGVGKLLSV